MKSSYQLLKFIAVLYLVVCTGCESEVVPEKPPEKPAGTPIMGTATGDIEEIWFDPPEGDRPSYVSPVIDDQYDWAVSPGEYVVTAYTADGKSAQVETITVGTDKLVLNIKGEELKWADTEPR